MIDFVIVVNDGGELKTIRAAEFLAEFPAPEDYFDAVLNAVLDKRAIAAGEYDPSDNDTPILVTMGGQ